jgi:hypothetical protein
MKNILVFYLAVFIPILVLVYCARIHAISSAQFAFGMLSYCLIYHPVISGMRLIQLNKIQVSQFWHTFIPGWNWKFFSSLFLMK